VTDTTLTTSPDLEFTVGVRNLFRGILLEKFQALLVEGHEDADLVKKIFEFLDKYETRRQFEPEDRNKIDNIQVLKIDAFNKSTYFFLRRIK